MATGTEATPICIITPTGLRCMSSPIKLHRPSGKECTDLPDSGASAKRKERIQEVSRALSNRMRPTLSKQKREVILTVVELMLAANVGGSTPFTIVKAG